MNQSQRYTFSGVEKVVNAIISFIFYYRLAFVFIGVGIIVTFEIISWDQADPEKWKTFSSILTGGSIIIGIFYWILNYEYNQLRFKTDTKNSRDVLTYNVASKMQDAAFINHFKLSSKFYEAQKHLLEENKVKEFHDKLEADPDSKVALLGILNFYECMAIGVRQGILEEPFLKEFFKSMFREYSGRYGPYIAYLQRTKARSIYSSFMELANKWRD